MVGSHPVSTMNAVRSLVLAGACSGALLVAGCGGGSSSSSSAPSAPSGAASTPSPSPSGSASAVGKGKRLFSADGCTACHSISGAKGIGPPLDGVAGSKVKLSGGSTVTADDAYLMRSIAMPSKQVVDGFGKDLMASTIKPGSIPAGDIKALVAYIKSLK